MENKKNNEGLIKLLCYLGIFVLLLFIVLPPLFWNLFPEEVENKEEEEQKKIVMNLSCTKTEDYFDYKIMKTISTNYIEERITKSMFTYEVEHSDEIFESDDILIEEYETFKKLANVDFAVDDNLYVISIDYVNFDYNNVEELLNHRKKLGEQLNYYTEKGYECKTSRQS